MPKILIVGSLAGGKKFLGQKLSQALQAPLYALDDIHWERKYERYRPAADRQKTIDDIVCAENWIIAGVLYDWIGGAIEKSERIVVLRENFLLEAARIVRRGVVAKLFDDATRISLKGILGGLKHDFFGYHLREGYGTRAIDNLQTTYGDKVVVLASKREANAFVEALSSPRRAASLSVSGRQIER
jgi:hypothetical protein